MVEARHGALTLERLAVLRGGRVIARVTGLACPSPGLTWIVGPGGAGKSSLLSALAGDPLDAGLSLQGRCEHDGLPLASLRQRMVVLSQHATLECGPDGELSVRAPQSTAPLAAGAVLGQHAGFGIDHRGKSLSDSERRFLAAEEGPADLVLVNLDAEGVALGGTPTRLGCSITPKQHGPGTLRRPFRSYEILSTLNNIAGRRASQGTAVAGTAWRLRVWPAEAADWSRQWWTVMAALRHDYRTVEDIALQTGFGIPAVRQCLARLEQLDALTSRTTHGATHPPAPSGSQRWRVLRARIGQIMGFSL